MSREQAREAAQEEANKTRINQVIFESDSGNWKYREQEYDEVICPEDFCCKCGCFESEKRLSYHEESGEGYDHTDGGDYCDTCWENTIGDI